MTRSTFFKSALLGLCSFTLVACGDAPVASDSSSTRDLDKASQPPPSNSVPIFAFSGAKSVTSKGTTIQYPGIMVMDLDGSDRLHVWVSPVSGPAYDEVSWGHAGSGTATSPWTVSFRERNTPFNNSGSAVRTMNVWVESGVPKGSTPVARFSIASGTGTIWGQEWSPVEARIAFTVRTSNSPIHDELRIMNSDGTGMTTLYSEDNAAVRFPRWSPDGQQIAFLSSGANGYHIKIYDRATSSVSTLYSTSDIIGDFDWSNKTVASGGVNRIAFTKQFNDAGSDRHSLWTIALASGSTPAAVMAGSSQLFARRATWSPDDTQLSYSDSYDGTHKIFTWNSSHTGGSVTATITPGGAGSWRK